MPAPIAAVPAPAPATPVVAKPAAPAPVAKGGVKGAPPPVETTVAAPEPKVKLKIDGQVEEMTQAEIERWASKGRFSDKTTQEAREAIKRATALAKKMESDAAAARERAKTDTDAWLKEHGIDPDEFAKSRLEKKVEEGKMTPEQRRAAELEQENKRLKADQDKLAKEREAERVQQVTNQLQKRIENELGAAAKRAGINPQDSELFFAVYESFREAFDLGLLPLDANGLLPHHADRIIEDAQGKLEGAQKQIRDNALKLKGQPLLDFIGREAVANIVTAELERIRAARGVASPASIQAKAAPQQRQPRTYISPAELDAEVKKLGAKL